MSTADARTALKVPGRIVVAASGLDFSAAFPHDGTHLGLVQSVRLIHSEAFAPVRCEDWGMSVEILDVLEAGERCVLTMALRGANPTAISTVFKNTTLGATSGERRVVHPGARGEGVLRSVNRSVQLLFSPIDPRHPAVYFPKAVPMIQAPREIENSKKAERIVLAGFLAKRYSAAVGAAYQIGPLEDLVDPAA